MRYYVRGKIANGFLFKIKQIPAISDSPFKCICCVKACTKNACISLSQEVLAPEKILGTHMI